MGSPTQRSLALLREQGYHAEVVEKWAGGKRHDLWGWCDILALRDRNYSITVDEVESPVFTDVLAVQTTTASNMSARIKKIGDSDTVGLVRACGIQIAVHGWAKKAGRWQCRVVDLS